MIIKPLQKRSLCYQKVSFPVQYGELHLIETPDYQFWFNLNGEPKYILGKRGVLHPLEWLKRTQGNDWVYYSAGDYNQFYDTLGEFYLPCFQYPSNALWRPRAFSRKEVQAALLALQGLPRQLALTEQGGDDLGQRELIRFLRSRISPTGLWQRALALFAINQSRVQVLPPDARDVDYDLIPVLIADGCLYNCGFCLIKDQQSFQSRSKEAIKIQVERLRKFYGPDLRNYSALFLGGNDALAAGARLIEFTVRHCFSALMKYSSFREKKVYLFASVDSFLGIREEEWTCLNNLPAKMVINIGLESFDQSTLDFLRKPVDSCRVAEAFDKVLSYNACFANMEFTVNFVLDPGLPSGHFQKLEERLQGCSGHFLTKGRAYLSPLSGLERKKQLDLFRKIKIRSKLPVYLYLLQRI